MPTASDRHHDAKPEGRGAETASNETPVSTAERPHGAKARAARPAKLLVKPLEKPVSPRSTAATGRDHPDESEHPPHEKLRGESHERLEREAHDKLQHRAAKQREAKAAKPKPH